MSCSPAVGPCHLDSQLGAILVTIFLTFSPGGSPTLSSCGMEMRLFGQWCLEWSVHLTSLHLLRSRLSHLKTLLSFPRTFSFPPPKKTNLNLHIARPMISHEETLSNAAAMFLEPLRVWARIKPQPSPLGSSPSPPYSPFNSSPSLSLQISQPSQCNLYFPIIVILISRSDSTPPPAIRLPKWPGTRPARGKLAVSGTARR